LSQIFSFGAIRPYHTISPPQFSPLLSVSLLYPSHHLSIYSRKELTSNAIDVLGLVDSGTFVRADGATSVLVDADTIGNPVAISGSTEVAAAVDRLELRRIGRVGWRGESGGEGGEEVEVGEGDVDEIHHREGRLVDVRGVSVVGNNGGVMSGREKLLV
jgi:hypothetical protein